MTSNVVVDEPPKLRPPACGVVHAWLETDAIAELEHQADYRGMHRDRLVAELLRAIIIHGLYEPLLKKIRP